MIQKLGEGTFSEVFKAQVIKTGEFVAMKCMKKIYKQRNNKFHTRSKSFKAFINKQKYNKTFRGYFVNKKYSLFNISFL